MNNPEELLTLPLIVTIPIVLIVIEKLVLAIGKAFCLYDTVEECEAKVYVLFGEVLGVINTPGLHFPVGLFGPKMLLVNIFGQTYSRSLAVSQEYLRSIPVNSEEGTPMGIGMWYEMYISDPVAHIFKNADPRGSLSANVKNATIKHLSNLPLSQMLINRHHMSKLVREEVTDESVEWGYKVGSVYIRKVHFRDMKMIKQIEQKVVNRLRQVTSAIQQDGANQVNIIMSKAEREASIEFAKATAVRPQIVGDALAHISKDPKVMDSLFEILETQRIVDNTSADLVLTAGNDNLITPLLASK
jgi:regulator of protease activity HflC (stomatin/prohibitin superfamily)